MDTIITQSHTTYCSLQDNKGSEMFKWTNKDGFPNDIQLFLLFWIIRLGQDAVIYSCFCTFLFFVLSFWSYLLLAQLYLLPFLLFVSPSHPLSPFLFNLFNYSLSLIVFLTHSLYLLCFNYYMNIFIYFYSLTLPYFKVCICLCSNKLLNSNLARLHMRMAWNWWAGWDRWARDIC